MPKIGEAVLCLGSDDYGYQDGPSMGVEDRRPCAYLAGPMRSYPEFNFPAFHEAAAYIRKVLGWGVISPAEMDLELGFNPNTQRFGLNDFYLAMRRDLAAILEPKIDRIVFLPKWEASRGANVERTIGEAIGLEMWYFIPGQHIGEPNVVTMLPPGL